MSVGAAPYAVCGAQNVVFAVLVSAAGSSPSPSFWLRAAPSGWRCLQAPPRGDQSRAAAARCVARRQPALLHAHQAGALTLGRQFLEQRQQVQA